MMARGLRNTVRGVALAGTSALAISCGTGGEVPPVPTGGPQPAMSSPPTAPSRSPADYDVYPGAGILSVENGKTFMDGCFTVKNPDGKQVMGIVRSALWVNSKVVAFVSTDEKGAGGVWPSALQDLTAENLYRPSNGSDVYHSKDSSIDIHCRAELSDMQFPDYALGHLALVQRDGSNKILFGQAPFNDSTRIVQNGPSTGAMRTTLPNGDIVAVHHVPGPK